MSHWKCHHAGLRPVALRVKHAKEKRKRNIKHTKKSKTRVQAIKYLRMYKPGGEAIISDASAEGLTRRPGRMWKMQGAVRAAVFSLQSI